MASTVRKKRSQKKLSPLQKIKGMVIKVGLARKVKKRDGELYFQPLWHRVVLAFLVLLVSGWFSLVTGAYFFVKHAREFPHVKYFDLAFPHRWEDYRVARGDYYIERAEELLNEGSFIAALHYLRVGVSHSPDNVDGRIALSQLDTARGRPDLGIERLKGRLMENADDNAYLSALFGALFANHEDAEVDRNGSELLGDDLEVTDRNSLIAYAVASANFNRGNYERAEQFINDYRLYTAPTGATLQAQVDWESGFRDMAIERLEGLIQRTGGLDRAYELLIQYYWHDDRPDRALQTALLHASHDPISHKPRLGLIRIFHLREEEEKRQRNIESYFRFHGEEEEAIQELARFAGSQGLADLADRAYEHGVELEMDEESLLLARLEAHVAVGNYRSALEIAGSIEEAVEDWRPTSRTRLYAIEAAAYFHVGDTENGDSHLSELATRRVAPGDMIALAEQLRLSNEYQRARRVLQQVRDQHPLHQQALNMLVKLDIETGNNRELMRNLPTLLSMRKPPSSLLQDARRHIASDLFLFESGRSEILETLENAIAEVAAVEGS